jgi:antitoxin (DNA-binding transcriptional repressor) of toxin-antitoxin stability system
MINQGGMEMQVNILEAKTNLSNLVRLVETGQEERIIIARYGKPVVKMVLYNDVPVSKRIGIAKGKLKSPEDLDKYNDEIAEMFGGAL